MEGYFDASQCHELEVLKMKKVFVEKLVKLCRVLDVGNVFSEQKLKQNLFFWDTSFMFIGIQNFSIVHKNDNENYQQEPKMKQRQTITVQVAQNTPTIVFKKQLIFFFKSV